MKTGTAIAIVAVGVVGYLVVSRTSPAAVGSRGGLEGTGGQSVLGKAQSVLGALDNLLGTLGVGKKTSSGLGLDCVGRDCLE